MRVKCFSAKYLCWMFPETGFQGGNDDNGVDINT